MLGPDIREDGVTMVRAGRDCPCSRTLSAGYGRGTKLAFADTPERSLAPGPRPVDVTIQC